MGVKFQKCLICDEEFENNRSLASHIQVVHLIKSKDYTIQYIYNNEQPSCPICNEETRYVSFTFKKYCKNHSHEAEREAGRIGGKIKKTWNKNKTKKDDERLMEYSKKYSGEGNPFYGKKHSVKTVGFIKNNNILSKQEFCAKIDKRKKDFELITDYNDYYSRQRQYLIFECKKCENKNNKTLQAFERGSLCKFCIPDGSVSKAEIEVSNYISTLNISQERNTRSVIPPKELDIYIPSKKFAIEYNGLFWHSEKQKGKYYHKEKTTLCDEKGIQLFHIFSDEWENKRSIVESMIKSRMGIIDKKIYARKCEIREVNSRDSKEFFEKSHISGYTVAKITFGLYYEDQLVCCVSLRSPHHKKYHGFIEIARFASLPFLNVVGGFTKLLNKVQEWGRQNKYHSIITYADLRFGKGNVYEKAKFSLVRETPVDYWYTDGIERYNRFKFRAQGGKTEKQIAEENCVYKTYGCGSNIYIKQI